MTMAYQMSVMSEFVKKCVMYDSHRGESQLYSDSKIINLLHKLMEL